MKTKKPRSKLQQVQAQANHAIYFRLRKLYPCAGLNKMVLSNGTRTLLAEYNSVVFLLQLAIKIDADKTKQLIRARDKKKIDNKSQ